MSQGRLDITDTTDPKKSEPILGILDTYHDFCKGERKKKSAGKEDETADKRVTIMRTYLPKLLHKTYGNFGKDDDYTQNIKTISNNKITSVSKIEHQTIELFEEKYKDQIKANPETREVITMKQILDAYGADFNEETNPLWKRFKTNEANCELEIQKDGMDLDEVKCRKLANFILNYFFFSSTEKDVHLTFDAADGTVGEIFRDIQTVKNIIFPQTIADSATTSLNVLKGRCDYIFPSATNEINFQSNAFSNTDYRIYFKNNETSPFGNSNPYGFSIVIELRSDPRKKVEVPFSSTQTEGPSVNYIIDILNTLQLAKNDSVKLQKISKKSSIVNLGLALDKYPPLKRELFTGIKNKTNGILPDLKRGGDHEAVNAAKYVVDNQYPLTIFTTIDMLCALKARKEKVNCIWQTSERLVLYRFPTVLKEDREKYSFVIKAQDTLDLIEKIRTLVAKTKKKAGKTKSVLDLQVAEQLAETIKALNGVYDVKGTNTKCKQVLNALLRMRILDFKTLLSTKKLKIEGEEEAIVGQAETALAIMKDKLRKELLEGITKEGGDFIYKDGRKEIKLTQTSEYQNKLKTIYEGLISKLKETIHVDINLTESDIDKKLMISKKLTQEETKAGTKYTVILPLDHSVFNYSTGPFVRFYEMMVLVEELVATASRRRDFPLKIKKFLQNDKTNDYNYFEIVEEILDQFQIEEIKNKLTEILNFSDKAITAATEASATTGSVNRDLYMQHYFIGKTEATVIPGVLDSVLEYYTELSTPTESGNSEKPGPIPYPISVMAGGSIIQAGGATGEYYELSDLLFSISTKAAAYIESAFSKHYTLYAFEQNILYLDFVWNQNIRLYGQQALYDMPYCIYLFHCILEYHDALINEPKYIAFMNSLRATGSEENPKTMLEGKWGTIKRYKGTFSGYKKDTNEQNYTVDIQSVPNTNPLRLMDSLVTYLKQYLTLLVEKGIKDAIKFPSLNELLVYFKSKEFNVPLEETEHVYLETDETPIALAEIEAPPDIDTTFTLTTDEPPASTDYEVGTVLVNGASKLLDELQEEWEYKLAELRKVAGYEFPSTFGTENFFTAFLALQANKTEEYLLSVNKPEEAKLVKIGFPYKDFKDILKPTTSQDDLNLYKLFLLTFLENIQNPRKYSFFLESGYKNRYFDSKGDWNNKLGGEVLPMLIQKLKGDASMPLKYNISSITYGGSRKYLKKTRKSNSKRQTRKSRKYNKTMRNNKH